MTMVHSRAAPIANGWPAAGYANNEVLERDGSSRSLYGPVMAAVEEMGATEIAGRWRKARREADRDNFTFLLAGGDHRTVPTDWLPRVIAKDDWDTIAAGVSQRMRALNRFLYDLYCGSQRVVPDEVVGTSRYFRPELRDVCPPRDLFVHIYGVDLVRVEDGSYVVLEDNLRVPSGISYQLKCLEIGGRVLPELRDQYEIVPFDISDAYEGLIASLSDDPAARAVLLTDGRGGSAFFEHRYLSDLLDIPLVEGYDLFVDRDGYVRAHTLDGDARVDVIYRRVDDLELFVPGLTQAYCDGKVALINAPGTGVADDKLVFLWVPEMIRHYLDEEPILRQAASYALFSPEDRRRVREDLDRLVLKTRDGYGGFGVFILPDLDADARAKVLRLITERPEAFIAQETLDFSQHLVFNDARSSFEPRYIDLRAFAVQSRGGEVQAFPGGLTRVARANTRITNNSSGGLCKETWVVQ
jgi:uncharacterized circularly permuted ATP-grasp superfamily protein